MRRILRNERGLTLVELLAVIVILGIIAAIAVPSIGNLIGDTEDDATVAEAIQIINAAKLYAASEGITSGELTQDDLASFLDNVEDDEYKVTIGEENGDITYTIDGHPATEIANSGKEADLIDYAN